MDRVHAVARLIFICCALAVWGCYSDPAGSHPCDGCQECEECVEGPDGPRCAATPAASLQCAANGNIHSYDSCDADEGVSKECPPNSECVETSDIDAECVCLGNWKGENCDICPDNWDAAQDCSVCANNWQGDGCEVCPGNWDPDQNCGLCRPGWSGTDCNTALECYGGEYDVVTNLCWQNPPPSGLMNWHSAVSYCDKLVLGAQMDWRMPSISELRSLIHGCPTTETDGECEVTDDCSATICWDPEYCDACQPQYNCFWIPSLSGSCENNYWSSTPHADKPDTVWFIGFKSGVVRSKLKAGNDAIRCVRSVE